MLFNNKDLLKSIYQERITKLKLSEADISIIQKWMNEFLSTNDILELRRTGEVAYTRHNGILHGCELLPLAKFNDIVTNDNFIYKDIIK